MIKKYIYIKTMAENALVNSKAKICNIKAFPSFDEASVYLEEEAKIHSVFTHKFRKKNRTDEKLNVTALYDENEGFYHFNVTEKTINHEDNHYMYEVRPYLAENNLTTPRFAFVHITYHTNVDSVPQIGNIHVFSLRKSAISYMEYYVEEFFEGNVPLSVSYDIEHEKLKAKFFPTEKEETMTYDIPNKFLGLHTFIIYKLN